MAAIFVYREGSVPIDRGELVRTRESMRARGPDGAGLWMSEDGRSGLAHRRLSIIDLTSAGGQPMATGDGRLRVVFNGEIYNYRSLRDQLERKGFRFRSTSDTEVLLHLYADKGLEMVHSLRGMYAFALWDESRGGILLARDPFGIKPLYYADDGRTLRAASQVKALVKGGGVDPRPDPAGHVGFFLWGYVPEPYTLYKAVKALPAGSTLWIDKSGRRVERTFCDIAGELAALDQSVPNLNPADLHERLREALMDSARHHLVADVPVGLFLSSGLDSTTLAALGSELVPEGLRTVTLGFKEYSATEDDETSLAERVARDYRTAHLTGWVSRNEFQSEVRHLLDAMDQPSIDGVNTYLVSKVAATAGLKVVWSGLGGDELFAGYPSFSQIPRMVRAFGPWQSNHLGKMIRRVSAPVLRHFTSPKYASLLEYGGSYSGAYLLRRGLFMPWELPGLLDGYTVREGWRDLQPLVRLEEIAGRIKRDRVKISALEATCYMRNQLLRDADWAGMAHSLEIRVPLVDLELLRRVAPLLVGDSPATKRDMALTPAKPLPGDLLRRRKTGFSVPLRHWLPHLSEAANGERGLRGWARKIMTEWDVSTGWRRNQVKHAG